MSRDLSHTVGQRVVRLPTAQPRQVKQPHNRAAREARAAIRDYQPPFPYATPSERRMEQVADAINSVERTPEMAVMLAIVGTMDPIQRAQVMNTLNRMSDGKPADDSASIAANLVAATILTVGEKNDLNNALRRAETGEPK